MTKLLLALTLTQTLATPLAFEIPYGVQDPMMGSAGFVNCSGGEIGYWNLLQQKSSDGHQTQVYMVLTSKDMADPMFLICVVPPDRKVLVMEPGKDL
jgi:hypothetical protein